MRVVILGSGRGSNAEAILKAQAAGRLGIAIGVAFGVVGILIVLSFRLNWHPFASYYIPK